MLPISRWKHSSGWNTKVIQSHAYDVLLCFRRTMTSSFVMVLATVHTTRSAWTHRYRLLTCLKMHPGCAPPAAQRCSIGNRCHCYAPDFTVLTILHVLFVVNHTLPDDVHT